MYVIRFRLHAHHNSEVLLFKRVVILQLILEMEAAVTSNKEATAAALEQVETYKKAEVRLASSFDNAP